MVERLNNLIDLLTLILLGLLIILVTAYFWFLQFVKNLSIQHGLNNSERFRGPNLSFMFIDREARKIFFYFINQKVLIQYSDISFWQIDNMKTSQSLNDSTPLTLEILPSGASTQPIHFVLSGHEAKARVAQLFE